MKRILTVTVVLPLLLLGGCAREPEQVFEGTIYTVAKPPDYHPPTIISFGPVDIRPSLEYHLRQDSFWQYHARLNPHLSESEVHHRRESVSVSSYNMFSYENEYFSKWTIRIINGDHSDFESVCETYRNYHRDQYAQGTVETSELLEARVDSLRHDIQMKRNSDSEPMNPKIQEDLRVQESNLAELEKMISEREKSNQTLPGRIVEAFMASPPNIPESAFIR